MQIDVSLEYVIDHYGYLAILIGTFLEGETILILGGVAAKLGYLHLPWVMLSALIGTLLGDQLFFFLGRYHGKSFLDKHPAWQDRTTVVTQMLERHRIPVIIGFRFLYGLRTATPFVIGMSRIAITEFLVLNIIGAALWATVIGLLGYAFGHGLELILGDIKKYELEIIVALSATGAGFWLIRLLRNKKHGRNAP